MRPCLASSALHTYFASFRDADPKGLSPAPRDFETTDLPPPPRELQYFWQNGRMPCDPSGEKAAPKAHSMEQSLTQLGRGFPYQDASRIQMDDRDRRIGRTDLNLTYGASASFDEAPSVEVARFFSNTPPEKNSEFDLGLSFASAPDQWSKILAQASHSQDEAEAQLGELEDISKHLLQQCHALRLRSQKLEGEYSQQHHEVHLKSQEIEEKCMEQQHTCTLLRLQIKELENERSLQHGNIQELEQRTVVQNERIRQLEDQLEKCRHRTLVPRGKASQATPSINGQDGSTSQSYLHQGLESSNINDRIALLLEDLSAAHDDCLRLKLPRHTPAPCQDPVEARSLIGTKKIPSGTPHFGQFV